MRNLWLQVFKTADQMVIHVPEGKVFKPKFPELDIQKDYVTIKDKNFWDKFPVNLVCPAKSSLDHNAVKRLVDTLGCSNVTRTEKVIGWIKNGASIGCEAHFRNSSHSKNTKGAYLAGPQVTDAIAAWVKAGFALGPVEEDEVPVNAKINSILTRTKPNGSVRIILNLSAPKGYSVNDGINCDDFPASMSSTEAWLKVINRAGRNCWISKTDYADAYKHIAVVSGDTNLQWFEWGGKFFKELCLIFGCSSSAGIFDATAKVILDLVCRKAQFPLSMTCQHLDDTVAAAPEGSNAIFEFDSAFQDIASYTGVRLAPRTDPDKSFAPCKRGVVFGVHYDTENWSWSIPDGKFQRLVIVLRETIDSGTITVRETLSLVGKLIHIKALIPTAKFNMFHIMCMAGTANREQDDRKVLEISGQCRRQLHFWLTMLIACPGKISIPKESEPAAWALEAYTDAAGGSLEGLGRGTGGVMGCWWFYVPWSKKINAGACKVDGVKVGRKLTALELIGPLITICAAYHLLRGRPLVLWVDNAGSVAIWRKGYSTSCALSSSIVTCMSAVAAAIGCSVHIKKIRRCSNPGSLMADALSKADFAEYRRVAKECGWELNVEPASIPAALIAWINSPVPDDNLAERILREIALSAPVLGFNV